MSIEIEVVDKEVGIKDQKEIADSQVKEVDDRANLKERLKLNFAKIYEMKKNKEDSYHQISQNHESPDKSIINNDNHFENISIKSKHSKQNSAIQNYSQISKVSASKERNSKIEMETDRELVTLSNKDMDSKSSKDRSEHFKTPSLKSSTKKEEALEKKECIPKKYRIALIMMIVFTAVISGLLCLLLLFL